MITLPTRIELIKELVKPDSVGAEIGVYRGGFSGEILKLPVKKLYLIDAWESYKAYEKDSLCHTNQDSNYEATLNGLAPDIKAGRCEVIKGYSTVVGLTWDKPLDFIFLDANHRYQFVLADLRMFSKFITPGGVIMCHDYTSRPAALEMDFGVVAAVATFCREEGWFVSHTTLEGDWPSCAIQRIKA
jgi:predicted O-methyltransferase YrrM